MTGKCGSSLGVSRNLKVRKRSQENKGLVTGTRDEGRWKAKKGIWLEARRWLPRTKARREMTRAGVSRWWSLGESRRKERSRAARVGNSYARGGTGAEP